MSAPIIGAAVRFPPVPAPGESVMGLVARAAAENVHATTAHILRAAGTPHPTCWDLALTRPELAPALAAALGVDVAALAPGLHLPVSTTRSLASVDFAGAVVPAADLILRTRRVCPEGLAGSPHHRMAWTHGLIPFCARSGGWLIDRCPDCDARLGWHHAAGIERCGSCGSDLRLATAGGPSRRRLRAALPAAALVHPDPDLHRPAEDALHADLKDLGRGQAFDLGWRLASIIRSDPVPVPRDHHRTLDRGRQTELLADAARILTGWPASVPDRLRDLLEEDGLPAMEKALRDLKLAFVKRRWTWASQVSLMAERHPFVLEHRQAAVRTLTGDRFVSTSDATRMLRTVPSRFAALHRSEVLRPASARGLRNCAGLFDADAMAALATRFEDRIHANGMSEALGIALHGVEQLCCIGELDALTDPVLLRAFPTLQLRRSSAEDLTRRLERALRPAPEGVDLVQLRFAAQTIGGRRKPWGPILRAVLAGTLAAYASPFRRTVAERRFSGHALIRASDVAMLREFAFDPAPHRAFPFAATMTRRDAEETLNLLPARMERLLAAGLRTRMVHGRFPERAVLEMAGSRISPCEVLRRWSHGSRALPRPLRLRGEDPAFGTDPSGWPREAVERLLDREVGGTP